MRKRHIIFIGLLLIFLILLCACEKNQNQTEKLVQITFQDENGSVYQTFMVKPGEPISAPSDPYKNNYIFIGWYTSPFYGSKLDLSKGITEDTVLYARFELDAANITNEITKNIMKGVVTIRCRSYKVLLGFIPISYSGWSQGSGFCYSVNNGYYYFLTNCHVVCPESGHNRLEIEIYDYKGNKYEGKLYTNSNKNGDAISPEYDLACLYFHADSSEVTPLTILTKNPDVNDDVIALGAPNSQSNAITFGTINGYQSISLNTTLDQSNVTFPTIKHSAYINNGSSGGPLLNSDLQVIGVNYALTQSTQTSHAIPAEKVQEFLKKYVYN